MSVEPDRHYFRNPSATAVTTAGRALFVMPGEASPQSTEVDPGVVSELWEALAAPLGGADLAARIAAGPQGLAGLVESLLARAFVLRGAPGEFRSWGPERERRESGRPCRHLVLGVTGAVQAVFVPHQVRRLALEFAQRLDVVLTPSAREFVQPRAIAALGAGVWGDPFEQRDGVPVAHLHLAAAAELVLVLPATADAIFRLAHGAASDLLSLVVCATRAPVVVAPSMNPTMWHHPAVRRNVETLRRDGVFVLEPGPAFSVAEGGEPQVGGAGLGEGSANLTAALEAILRLSR